MELCCWRSTEQLIIWNADSISPLLQVRSVRSKESPTTSPFLPTGFKIDLYDHLWPTYTPWTDSTFVTKSCGLKQYIPPLYFRSQLSSYWQARRYGISFTASIAVDSSPARPGVSCLVSAWSHHVLGTSIPVRRKRSREPLLKRCQNSA